MTTTTSGNPHSSRAGKYIKEAYYADDMGVREIAKATAEATLALAYEQRTANLIAAFGQLGDGDDSSYLGDVFDAKALAREIVGRLGTESTAMAISIPIPHLSTKAKGSHEYEYLFSAADKLRNGFEAGGSGVRNMIASIITDVAQALIEQEHSA